MGNNQTKPRPVNWAHAVIGLLAAALLVVVVWFGLDIHSLYRQGVISHAESRVHRRPGGIQPLTPGDIRGWMTFRYIEFAFRLPPNYLATKLNISTSNYLDITLNAYAGARKLNAAAFTLSVTRAVVNYQDGNNP